MTNDEYALLDDPQSSASDELFIWCPAPAARWRAIRNGILVATIPAMGAWGLSQYQPSAVAKSSALAVQHVHAAEQVQTAKDADAAGQRAILQHVAPLKWSPPLETNSVVRDITDSTKQ